MQKENISLNFLQYDRVVEPVHPLLWTFVAKGMMQKQSSNACEEFIVCMLDNDILITDEVNAFLNTEGISDIYKELIYKHYCQRYRQLLEIIIQFMPRDATGVVLRYLVGDALYERAESIPASKAERRPASQALFQPKPVEQTREEKTVVTVKAPGVTQSTPT